MRRRKILLTVLIAGSVGAVTGAGSYSAFTATTANTGNSIEAGSVTIEDNDVGAAMLSLATAKPNDSDTSCIKLRYTGSLASSLRLYASVSGSLASYLNVAVTRGTGAAAFDDCTGLTADATNYTGNGPGVLYSGTLAAFPATYAAAIVDPAPSWATGEEHWYQFSVSVQDNGAAQGQTASADFTWEARNQ
jgi:hypothetical protein